MAEEELVFRAIGEDVSAGRMLGDLARKTDKASGEIGDLNKELGHLDRQLKSSQDEVKRLIKEFDQTGDRTLLRDIGRADRNISQLTRLRKRIVGEVEEAGQEAGKALSGATISGMSDALGALPSQLKGAAIVAGVGVAAAMTPFIGAAIGGAVLGGAGAGGILGGVMLAAKDPTVAAAGEQLGHNLLGFLEQAASPFERPLLDSIGRLQDAGAEVAGELHSDFAGLAPLVTPVTKGLVGLVHEAGPGLSVMFKAAQPAIRAISNELPHLGHAFTEAADAIASGSDGGTEALIELMRALEKTVVVGGQVIGFLENVYDDMLDFQSSFGHAAESAGSWAEYINPPLYAMTQAMGDAADEADTVKDSLGRAKNPADDFAGSLSDISDESGTVATLLEQINTEMDKLFGIQMNLDEANLHYKQGLIKLKEELIDGKRTLDQNTSAGQENAEAVLRQIKMAQDVRDAEYERNHNLVEANKHYQDHIATIKAYLIQLGYNKTDVEKLISAYQALNALPSVTKNVDVVFHYQGANRFDRYMDGRASGGPVMAGKSYIVGEQGPEIVNFGSNGYVHNATQTQRMLSGASGGSRPASSGGGMVAVVSVKQSESTVLTALAQAFVPYIQVEVINQGGDVNTVLGAGV